MSFLTGPSKNSWQPVMTANTTNPDYWLNWRVLLCGIWLLMTMAVSSFLISKHEGPRNSEQREEVGRESQRVEELQGMLYEDEVWMPCLRGIHPAWLLSYRLVAFFVLLLMLILNIKIDGSSILYFYTQWTFTLVTIYFGLGTLLSIHGCNNYNKDYGFDAERGTHQKFPGPDGVQRSRRIAGFWEYVFQIIFQMNAGAVVLTDCVFWFILVPFLTIKDYNLNFLVINMHTANAVFLVGDTALNSLRFPWFRIAYFFLWTTFYVGFQWIIHACIALWWPYPFLDLSSTFAPVWYSSLALMHVPCFGLFILVMRMKHCLLSKWFPRSYRCV